MEGYNCHVPPLDSVVEMRGWQLFNVNNLKLARFKDIFRTPAKSNRIDSAKTLELFQLRDHLPMARDLLQEGMATSAENDILKRLSIGSRPVACSPLKDRLSDLIAVIDLRLYLLPCRIVSAQL